MKYNTYLIVAIVSISTNIEIFMISWYGTLNARARRPLDRFFSNKVTPLQKNKNNDIENATNTAPVRVIIDQSWIISPPTPILPPLNIPTASN